MESERRIERHRTIAPGTAQLDIEYLGREKWIATAVLDGDDGFALVDPGPTSALPGLRLALESGGRSLERLRAIVLTHIHLDHAGATGTLVREHPDIDVWVHERGARHLADPARLMASATRLYGDQMDWLWGEMAPVPQDNLRPLAGGEAIRVAGHALDVAYTPGHASHHVSYFDAATRIAYVGDTAGLRIDGARFVLPVTPPPDIDLELWAASTAKIREWQPDRLFVTHFGVADDAAWHLDDHERRLREHAERVRASLNDGRGEDAEVDAERARAFSDSVWVELRASLPDDVARLYKASGSFEDDWRGLARYWRKKADTQVRGAR